jgi:NADH-quinone oxidoreductase subunit A
MFFAEGSHFVLTEYLPILLFLFVAGGIGVALLGIGAIMGPHKTDNAEKAEAYECGFEAFEDARMKFDVRYYLIAILFIIFDLEIAFLFPWAVVFKQIGVVAIAEMATFLLLLLLGFVYCWKKGALEWE